MSSVAQAVRRVVQRPRWVLIFAALVMAVPVVVVPVVASAPPASAATTLAPGFTIGGAVGAAGGTLGNTGAITNFAYLPGGNILAIGKTGYFAVGTMGGGWTRLTINGVDQPMPNLNSDGDRGLVGLAIDPSDGTQVYVLYDYNNPGDGKPYGRLSHWTLNDPSNPTNLSNEQVVINDFPSFSDLFYGTNDDSHTVGTVLFAPDGTLYVGNGDGSSWSVVDDTSFGAQDPNSPRGKIFHIDRNGNGVAGNPYLGQPGEWASRVFALGFRNPFRFSLKPGSSDILYVGDVGFNDYEEIDVVHAGQNFGWPCYEGPLDFQNGFWAEPGKCPNPPASSVTAPIYTYHHYGQAGGNAVIGGEFYNGTAYGGFNGSYFFGDNPAQRIWTLKTDASDNPVQVPSSVDDFFGDQIGFPTAFHIAPDGNMAYSDISSNAIYEIVGCAGNCPPVASATVSPTAGPPNTVFTFDGSKSYDPDGGPLSYEWDFNGDGNFVPGPAVVQHTYGGARTTYHAQLRVTDNGGLQAVTTVTVSTLHAPPSISLTPNKPGVYAVGETATMTANATGFDTSDQAYPLGGGSVKWQLILHHCPTGVANACHVHPDTPSPQPTGSTFSTAVPDHGDFSYLEFQATATDNDGLTATASFNLPTDEENIYVTSNVPGSPVAINTHSYTTPALATGVANSANQVIAAPTAGGQPFKQWSDGSTDPTRNFTMPVGGVAFTACYGDAACVNNGPPGVYTPVTPYRLFDTREASTSPTGVAGPLLPGQTLSVDLSSQPGAPAGKTAVLLNVTTDGPVAAGYVKAFPCGGAEPYISTVNFDPGQTAANLAMVRLPADNRVCFTSFVPTNVIVDVSGWYGPATSGGQAYTTIDPVRVLDTRETGQTLAAGQELAFSLAGKAGFPADASAALINLTATNTKAPGYVRVYPCGQEQTVSNVNYVAGQNVANLAAVKVAAGGMICFRSYAATDIVVDLAGWYAPSGTSQFAAASPVRLFDTRSTPGMTRLAPMQELAVPLVGGLVPPGATSVALNVTAAAPDAAGYVAVYPCGTSPFISNVNYRAQQVAAANLAVVKLSSTGSVCFKSFASTDLVVDLAGWYVG